MFNPLIIIGTAPLTAANCPDTHAAMAILSRTFITMRVVSLSDIKRLIMKRWIPDVARN